MIIGFILGVFATALVVFFLRIFQDGNQYDAEIARMFFEQKQKYCEYLESRNAELEKQIKTLKSALDENHLLESHTELVGNPVRR